VKYDTRDLLAYLDRVEPGLDRLSYFELLDIDGDAGDRAIQESFHRLAGRIHPDRYRQTLSARDLERLTTVYARIAHAYTELRDPARRKRYVADLAGGSGGRPAATGAAPAAPAAGGDTEAALAMLNPKAQRLYRRAEASLRSGDVASAVLNLRMALAIDRGSALLREALADAEARQKK
jgi:DnaJ-class molecular chaperone